MPDVLTIHEVVALLVLVSALNPDDYEKPAAKAVIFKSQSIVSRGETEGINLKVVGT